MGSREPRLSDPFTNSEALWNVGIKILKDDISNLNTMASAMECIGNILMNLQGDDLFKRILMKHEPRSSMAYSSGLTNEDFQNPHYFGEFVDLSLRMMDLMISNQWHSVLLRVLLSIDAILRGYHSADHGLGTENLWRYTF